MSTKKSTRQGQRAPGKTQTSISLRKDLLDWARDKADSDGRSLSNWIEQLIRSQSGSDEPVAKSRK
jgi:hypothetical protein